MLAGGFEQAGKIVPLGLLHQLVQVNAASLHMVPLLVLFKPGALFARKAMANGFVVAHAKRLPQVQIENVVPGNAAQLGNALLLCSGKKHVSSGYVFVICRWMTVAPVIYHEATLSY